MVTSVASVAWSSGSDSSYVLRLCILKFNIAGGNTTTEFSFHQASPQMAECPAVSKGKPNVTRPTTTHIAALT